MICLKKNTLELVETSTPSKPPHTRWLRLSLPPNPLEIDLVASKGGLEAWSSELRNIVVVTYIQDITMLYNGFTLQGQNQQKLFLNQNFSDLVCVGSKVCFTPNVTTGEFA